MGMGREELANLVRSCSVPVRSLHDFDIIY